MPLVNLLQRKGSGRAFLVLCERWKYSPMADILGQALCGTSTVLLSECVRIDDFNRQAITEEVIALAAGEKLKQVSPIAFGPSTAIAQELCLREPRLVRSMVLFDPRSRPHAGLKDRCLDWLEKSLPMGLPFRLHIKGFDSRPFLQRMRCPVLVISTAEASAHDRFQSRLIAENLPSAWFFQAAGDSLHGMKEYCSLLQVFERVPARCPQNR